MENKFIDKVSVRKRKTDKDYYEIRLESIGGLGANLCGKMLGELGIKYLDVNSSNFSSYGSEKTGTPVKGYIRYCRKEKEIRVHFPVEEPDILVVFHQALLKDESVLRGCSDNTKIIVALDSAESEEKVVEIIRGVASRKAYITDGGVGDGANPRADNENFEVSRAGIEAYGLEAQKIAIETRSRINVVMLGAILKVMGLKSIESGEKIVTDVLGKKYPDALKGNLEGMARGYEEVRRLEVVGRTIGGNENRKLYKAECNVKGENLGKGCEENAEFESKKPAHAKDRKCEDGKVGIGQASRVELEIGQADKMQSGKWGYKTAPIGGINPRLGSTVIADLSPSRQGYIPIFIKERCINCGQCHLTCPDMVFQFAKGEYKGKEMMVNQGLDYYHCKGCLRCVDICPVNALVMGVEAKHLQAGVKYFMPNQELIRMPKYYEKAGADGYITSESYLTEERMEGGEV